MELFYSEHGRRNPDFVYKVKINRQTAGDLSTMMDWCDDYPVEEHECFKRYYLNFRDDNDEFDGEYVTFQFEWEEPALLFALKFT